MDRMRAIGSKMDGLEQSKSCANESIGKTISVCSMQRDSHFEALFVP